VSEPVLDINAILRQLPHRYPFLLVDRVLECREGESIRALKNVTYNEPYFPGHFPYRPVMPGVIIIEALAQVAGILAFRTAGVMPDEETRFYFVGIDKARFRRPVEPGDQLILTARLQRQMRGIWKFEAVALVGDVEVASAELMVAPETGKRAPGLGCWRARSTRGRSLRPVPGLRPTSRSAPTRSSARTSKSDLDASSARTW
jgi:3-hydroxyacyl-[acyl-carrier-protein] dehydratase